MQAASDAEDGPSGRSECEGEASASSGSGSDANSGDGAAVQVWHQLAQGLCLHTVGTAGTLRVVPLDEPTMRRSRDGGI